MAQMFKPPSKRKTQGTQVGMPQVAGRKPYAPAPLLNQQPGTAAPAPATGTAVGAPTRPTLGFRTPLGGTTIQLKTPASAPPGREAIAAQTAQYFGPAGERDRLGKRQAGAVQGTLSMEELLKERQAGEFNALRRSYLESLGIDAGAIARGQTEAMGQSLRRRGSEFAGYAPAAETAIRASVAGKAVETLADFESQLQAAHQQELAMNRKGMIDFVNLSMQMLNDSEVQKDMAKFQQGLQDNGGWQELMGAVGQVVGAAGGVGAITGAIGGMFGGGGGGTPPVYAQPQGGTNPAYVGPSLVFR